MEVTIDSADELCSSEGEGEDKCGRPMGYRKNKEEVNGRRRRMCVL